MADAKLTALPDLPSAPSDADVVYIVRGSTSYKTTYGALKVAIAEFAQYPEVANFAALPSAAANTGNIYVCLASQGVYFVNRKSAGLYVSNGSTWDYLADATEAYFQDTLAWTNITSKPSTFAPSAHTHPASDISDSTAPGRTLLTAANSAAQKTALGLVSSDVGLGNVDNTSDTAKNTAAVTLTNKTISGASNTLTNIAQSSVTNLVADLAGKAASSHTHTSADVTDFNSASRAQTEAELVAGTNITITPSGSGPTRQLTIAASGGGSSPTTTEGDLIVRGSSTDQRLAIGTDGYVLTVDTSISGKTKWAAVSGGGSVGSNAQDAFTGNGSTTVFTLSSAPASSVAQVSVNGLIQKVTTDYSISGTSLTFVTAPDSGDELLAFYSAPVGATTATEIEVDFGTNPVFSKTFTITDATVSAAKKITASSSGAVATSRVEGDDEWDMISYSVKPLAGTFKLYAYANPGPVVGKRKVNYIIAA